MCKNNENKINKKRPWSAQIFKSYSILGILLLSVVAALKSPCQKQIYE